jgi:hypothetical protein
VVAREVRLWMKEKVKEGVPIARVAREDGVSRPTIYNLLAAASSPAKERKARGSKLDPFKSHIVFHPLPSVYKRSGGYVTKRQTCETGYSQQLASHVLVVRERACASPHRHPSSLPPFPCAGKRALSRCVYPAVEPTSLSLRDHVPNPKRRQ